MIYVCEDCGFIFLRTRQVINCPACEHSRLRTATASEEALLKKTVAKKTANPVQVTKKIF